MKSAAPRTGIVSLQPKEWNDNFRPMHYVMERLARNWPVVWMNPTHTWRDIWRRGFSAESGFSQPVGGLPLSVYQAPAVLPVAHRPAWLRRALERARLGQAVRRLKELGCDRTVLYAWHPKYLEATDLVEHDLLVYHVVDEYTYSPDDPPTTPRELAMIRRAGQTILHSPGLLEKKGAVAPERTAFVPNGVDFEAFAAPGAEPGELAGIPRPRIGYCGVLKRQLNWQLLQDLVERHPDWQWVFVGQWQESHRDLAPTRAWMEARPNVHLTGPVPATRLGEFPAHFDVGIMPYVVDGHTRYIYPLKLHEYLAAGIPVVGTPIRTLREFPDVVSLAGSVDDWTAELEAALSPASRDPDAVRARQQTARAYDWDLLTERIAGLIENGLRG